jgi:hypothetical protein
VGGGVTTRRPNSRDPESKGKKKFQLDNHSAVKPKKNSLAYAMIPGFPRWMGGGGVGVGVFWVFG